MIMRACAGFIVLSTQRTGSHLLRSVIRQHPAFVLAGEALIPGTSKPGSLDGFLATAPRAGAPEQLWGEYLLDLCNHKPSATYAGLLVKYEHVDRVMGRDFISDPAFQEIQIVHLVRHNVLRMIASHHLAVARGAHVRGARTEFDIDSVEIPPDDVLRLLRKRVQLIETFRERLKDRPRSCEIAYEEIMDGELVSESLIARLCEFFAVDDAFPRQPKTVKLGPDRLREMIRNYDLVAEALRGSEFEGMLE